ncbi:MAG: FecR domain-containing protein [Candidatus Odyssella sp.]|nr:FecR domain-containing protein [Candidatus Odyssella sp.]
MTIRSICAAVALALAAGHAGSAAAAPGDKAGVTASVRGQVQQVSFRTPQASIGRNVGSGDEVFLGDRIVTRAGSGVQIMLLDGTTFSIGPDASMVIDEFVYNPATNTGRLAATLTRGTLRVISGRLGRQDDEAIRVKLPQATVGIRGTMAILSGDPGGFFIGLFGVGPNNQSGGPASYLSIGINGTVYNIFRTGYGCMVTAAAPVCNPAPVDPKFLAQLLGLIAGNLRQVDLVQFESLTGLDLFQALQMLESQNYEGLFQRFDQLFQDQNRPGPAPVVPTVTCPYYYCCSADRERPPEWADAKGPPPGTRRATDRRKHGPGKGQRSGQLVAYCG